MYNFCSRRDTVFRLNAPLLERENMATLPLPSISPRKRTFMQIEHFFTKLEQQSRYSLSVVVLIYFYTVFTFYTIIHLLDESIAKLRIEGCFEIK